MTLTVEIKPSNPNDLPALLREVADDIETYKEFATEDYKDKCVGICDYDNNLVGKFKIERD